jgi:SAM-dependent methyltransferase
MTGRVPIGWDDGVYDKGLQLNKYPFTNVVSAFMRRFPQRQERRNVKVLEIGFGAGNNIEFLAREGFLCWGIEQSQIATAHAKNRLRELEFKADLCVGDMRHLPFPDNSFNIVLDRSSITHNPRSMVPQIAVEIHRVLLQGGALLSFDFHGDEHPGKKFGVEIEPGTCDHFFGGPFATVGITSFWDANELKAAFRIFHNVSIIKYTVETDNSLTRVAYDMIAVKSE